MRVGWLVLATVGALSVGAAPVIDERDLLDLSTAAIGDSLPPGWQRRPVRGSRSPESVVRDDGRGSYLAIRGRGQAAWFALDLRRQPLSRDGAAALEYRLPVVPVGTDLTITARSDAALRLYFVFAGGRRLRLTPRTLFYSLGTLRDGPRTAREDNVCDVRLSQTSTTQWQRLEVTPAIDAARACGWTDGRIVAVGLMQDTDQTGGQAEADVRALTWRE